MKFDWQSPYTNTLHVTQRERERERGKLPSCSDAHTQSTNVNTYYEVSNETSVWFPGSAEGRVCSAVYAVYCAQWDKPASNSPDPADHTHVSMYCTPRHGPVFAHVRRAGT